MEKAIIGKKIGMTQIFDEAGKVIPVTLIQAGPCTVVQKKTAEKAVNAVIACIGDALASGDKIQIAGFGTFEVRERAAKTARNPRTGETIDVPACKVPAFKAGSALKDAVAK